MYRPIEIETLRVTGQKESFVAMRLPMKGRKIKLKDRDLAKNLIKSGGSHAKFSRGILVWARMKFQIGFMVELDTYRIGREVLSTSSTMHTDLRHLEGSELATEKQKGLSEVYYDQVATYSFQTLRRIYKERKSHRHPDWKRFCKWIESLEDFDLIMPEV